MASTNVPFKRARDTSSGSEEDAGPDATEHDLTKRRRKEQRMHRNRQSAARSRKRKEDKLEILSTENKSLREELNRLKSQLAAATKNSQGFAAVNPSNFIVLMKLAAISVLIHTAIFVATFFLELTPPMVWGSPILSPHLTSGVSTLRSVPRRTMGFAMAVMPFAFPTPVI